MAGEAFLSPIELEEAGARRKEDFLIFSSFLLATFSRESGAEEVEGAMDEDDLIFEKDAVGFVLPLILPMR